MFEKYFREQRQKELARSIHETEANIDASWKRYSSEFDDATKGMSQNEVSDYVDYHYDDLAFRRDDLPNFTRQAFYIKLFSVLENELHSTAEFSRKRKGIKLSPKDLRGGGVERSVNFLKKILEIDVDPSLWEKIKDHNIVRNQIVHCNGLLRYEHNDFNDIQRFASIAGNPIKFEPRGNPSKKGKFNQLIVLEAGSLELLHKDSSAFLNSVCAELATD